MMTAHPADRPTLRLIDRLSLQVDLFRLEDAPVWLAVTQHGTRATVTCWGAGSAAEDALCRCLGEVAERTAATDYFDAIGDSAQSQGENTSSGCAAHRDLPSARLAALLELIEREAIAIWWHARCPRPALRLTGECDEELQALLAWRDRSSRASWLLDLTHDLGIPIVAAVSLDGDRLPALGVAARPCLGSAARAALLELAQAEFGLALERSRWGRATEIAPSRRRTWLEAPGEADLAVLRPCGVVDREIGARPHPADADQLADVVVRLRSAGLTPSWQDISRPKLAVPVVRVHVPGLCGEQPASWRPRLLDVAVRLGWRADGLEEQDLHGEPLLI